MATTAAEDRFWTKVSKTDTCWEWLAHCNSEGYAKIRWEGKWVGAHRVSLVLAGVAIPPGYDVDHLCRNRGCVNPDHLEPVTHQENVRRGITGLVTAQRQMSKTHCPQGHPYDEVNTFRTARGRGCRTCHRERVRAVYRAQRDEISVRRRAAYRARKAAAT